MDEYCPIIDLVVADPSDYTDGSYTPVSGSELKTYAGEEFLFTKTSADTQPMTGFI
jgi:hypothetical protein